MLCTYSQEKLMFQSSSLIVKGYQLSKIRLSLGLRIHIFSTNVSQGERSKFLGNKPERVQELGK